MLTISMMLMKSSARAKPCLMRAGLEKEEEEGKAPLRYGHVYAAKEK